MNHFLKVLNIEVIIKLDEYGHLLINLMPPPSPEQHNDVKVLSLNPIPQKSGGFVGLQKRLLGSNRTKAEASVASWRHHTTQQAHDFGAS